jgi:tRNA(Phe) wybutosine-synthesizing methylase Tyw3
MVLEINTKMNSVITKEEFQNNFEKLVTTSDLEKVVDRVKREITTEMTEQMDKLESRIFELEIKNDDLLKKK